VGGESGTSGTSGANGGDGGLGAAAAGASAAGPMGGSAGRTSTGGASSDAGRSGESGAPGGETGATSGNAGTAPAGGAAGTTGGSAGHGGSSGASGAGGVAGESGAAGACTGCGLLESCWSDASGPRCIASSVPLPTGLGIDATEVTRGQYFAWLVREPTAADQPAECDWNGTFMPDPTCMTEASVCQGDACVTHPQPCVDLCDAIAYCSAIGRRLCTEAEWTSACSSDGAYPLGRESGGSFGMSTCNDYIDGRATTVPVASKTGCQPPAGSGFAGVFDLIGNVEEWVDDCRAADDVCSPRGLSFGMGAAAPSCGQSTYAERSVVRDNLGFRCCSPEG
jgi:hypothetical protein